MKLPCDRTHKEAKRLLRFVKDSFNHDVMKLDSTEFEPWLVDRLCRWLQRYEQRMTRTK